MRPFDDSLFLTPEQRFQQIAGLLARGLLRLQSRPAGSPSSGEHPSPKNPPDSGPGGLELSPQTVLSVHKG